MGFFCALIEFSAYLCGHEESNIAAPATGNSCHSTFLSDSGLNFFLFGTAHQLSLNPGEPPTGEQKVSLPGEQRDHPQRYIHTSHSIRIPVLFKQETANQVSQDNISQCRGELQCFWTHLGPQSLGSIFPTTHPNTLLILPTMF